MLTVHGAVRVRRAYDYCGRCKAAPRNNLTVSVYNGLCPGGDALTEVSDGGSNPFHDPSLFLF